ncbi:hypothetical protein WJX74_007318 [Apatococcus lobatus]|uniref:Uncharacterized protein n=1 Tax=Apatococcus lobatus TaxID=904363 RepID=A0AAW1RPW8_9CHLO
MQYAVVDSEPEVTAGCIDSAAALWPDVIGNLKDQELADVKAKMRTMRPVMNSTWEFLVAVRLLATDTDVTELQRNWSSACHQALKEWGTSERQVEEHSQKFRKQRVAGNEEAFIENNKLYSGVADAVAQCQYPWYVITSRAKDRTLKLLKGLLSQNWPEDTPRLYAGLSPPNERKIAAIRDIAQRPLVTENKACLHFVDDRFETVQAVLEARDLRGINLKVYLADWGYNTEDEREAAEKMSGLLTINLKQFAELMQWGMVMGVDDGCGDDN